MNNRQGNDVVYLDTIVDFGKFKGQGMTLKEIELIYPEYIKYLKNFTTVPLVFKNKPTEQ